MLLQLAAAGLLLHATVAAAATPQPCALATQRATLAEQALREHFWNQSTGLWDESLWWQRCATLQPVCGSRCPMRC